MRRKLLVLDLLLLALVTLVGWRAWKLYLEGEARLVRLASLGEPKLSTRHPQVVRAPMPQGREPVRAADYAVIASRLLFAPDRSPDVVVKVEEPQPPPLPTAHGVINLGAGPVVLLSGGGTEAQKAYRVGEKIGELVIAEIRPDVIAFAWRGKLIRRKLDELKPAPKAEAAQPSPTSQATTPQRASVTSVKPVAPGPSSVDLGGGIRACQPGDTSPPGTVIGGYRKVVTQTPFGQMCRWEPVQ